MRALTLTHSFSSHWPSGYTLALEISNFGFLFIYKSCFYFRLSSRSTLYSLLSNSALKGLPSPFSDSSCMNIWSLSCFCSFS